MDKNTSLDWIKSKFKSKLDKGKNEAVRLSKIGKIRIEISSLNKKKEEFMTILGKKVYQLIEEGKISKEYFEPDYTEAVQLDKNIQDLIDKIAEINAFYDNIKYEDDEEESKSGVSVSENSSEEEKEQQFEEQLVETVDEKVDEENIKSEEELSDVDTNETEIDEKPEEENQADVIEMPPVKDDIKENSEIEPEIIEESKSDENDKK